MAPKKNFGGIFIYLIFHLINNIFGVFNDIPLNKIFFFQSFPVFHFIYYFEFLSKITLFL